LFDIVSSFALPDFFFFCTGYGSKLLILINITIINITQCMIKISIIAGAPQIFQKKNFCFIFIMKTSPGSEKKKVFMKNLTGASNII
jgi:hypothetical protein